MVKVSVISPAYNAELHLSDCLDSVLSQAYTDLEVVVVNDGSSDRTLDICNQHAAKDSRVLVVDKENGGVSSSRNAGVERASGEWFFFLDSDDSLTPDFSNLCLQLDESDDYVVAGYKTQLGKVENFGDCVYRGSEVMTFVRQKSQSFLFKVCWCKFYKASIIRQNNLCFNPNMFFSEDTAFVLSYLRFVKKIRTCSATVYSYIENSDDSKYVLSASTAIRHLSVLYDNYKALGVDSDFMWILSFFYRIVLINAKKNNNRADMEVWYADNKMQQIYSELKVRTVRHFKFSVKYMLNRHLPVRNMLLQNV